MKDLLELYCITGECEYTERSRDEEYLARQIDSHKNLFPGHDVCVDMIEKGDEEPATLGLIIIPPWPDS